MTSNEWARIAVAAYKGHRADRVVAETNNVGVLARVHRRIDGYDHAH
jgi:phage terminase large subunit-like protein